MHPWQLAATTCKRIKPFKLLGRPPSGPTPPRATRLVILLAMAGRGVHQARAAVGGDVVAADDDGAGAAVYGVGVGAALEGGALEGGDDLIGCGVWAARALSGCARAVQGGAGAASYGLPSFVEAAEGRRRCRKHSMRAGGAAL
jgi:hypothetical protein